jgi:superfamily II DNA or RNA helicase
MTKPLREHQAHGINTLRQALASGSKRPMLMLPTGGGKTRMAAEIINRARQRGKRVTFTVPAISLVDQTVREFYAEGIRDVGVIQADHYLTDYAKPVQIASIDTLRARGMDAVPPADLVMVDEAHRRSTFLTDWMEHDDWLGVPFIGLSATPWTKGLGRIYDRLIIAATTQELIDKDFLSPFRVFAPSHPDLTGVRTVNTVHGRDYHEGDIAAAMMNGALVADIVATWLAKGENRPTLCFAVDRTHAKTIQQQFGEAGVACGYIDANTPATERDAIRKEFQAKRMPVVVSVGCLTTGVDWDVRCISLCRPTKSEMLFCQMIGRGLRTAPGKADCLILDHSDTTLRLGFVTDIHHDRLDGGVLESGADDTPQERQKAKPKECPRCHFVRPPGLSACPSCGFVVERSTEVQVVDGELIDLTAARKANRVEDWEAKAAFIAELRAYAAAKGKPDKWVDGKYRAKWGVWPNDPRVRYAKAAASVSPEVRSWITAQGIRWAKSQEKAKRQGVAA